MKVDTVFAIDASIQEAIRLHGKFPIDKQRASLLIAEEHGEVIKEVVDHTRGTPNPKVSLTKIIYEVRQNLALLVLFHDDLLKELEEL